MNQPEMTTGRDLDPLHWDIIYVLQDGRATPRYLSKRVNESRQLVSKRLRDLQMADIVVQIDRGLYELDPDEVPEDTPEGWEEHREE